MKKRLTLGQQMGRNSQKKLKEKLGDEAYRKLMSEKANKRWKKDGDKSTLQDTSIGI